MRRLLSLLCVCLVLPALVWGQAQVINGNRVHAGWTNYGTTAGTATAYTLTFSPALPGYVQGQCFLFKPHLTNTGAATLNVQGKGALALIKRSGSSFVSLIAGDLVLGHLFEACYDGTDLQLMGTAPDATGTGVTDGDKGDLTVSVAGTVWTIDPGAVTYGKLPQASTGSRLFGSSSTGAGPWQEISLGANLAMSGTTLNAAGGSGVADADKGDITVSGTGTVWTIDPGAVTYAKLQNVSATARMLGRQTAGAGPLEELTPAAVKAMLGMTFGDIAGTATAAQLPQAAADSTTKGIAAFQATEFNATAGVIALDYANAQAASATTKGFLTAADWVIFNTKQAALGFAAEDVARKNPSPTLGTSNTDYPTQGAVKQYVDSGPKALTNTALTPRTCALGAGSPLVINADNLTGCDVVTIADLSGATTFDITGIPVNGQFVSIALYTAVARTVTWTSGVGKFSAENGIALPTTTAAGYDLWGFRYNSHSNRWAFVATPRGPAGSGSSDGTLHAADYGVVCDGTTDTAPMLQAAITAARRAQSGEPFLGKKLVMPATSNTCKLGSTILIEDTRGLEFDGSNAKFTWSGLSTAPMFLFRDARQSDFHHFEVNPGNPTTAVFRYEGGPGSFVSTTNELHHIFVECFSGACFYGIEVEIGGGGDGQNDLHMFHHMSFNNVTDSCAYINGSQAKMVSFEDFECMNNLVGKHVIKTGPQQASFNCVRCKGFQSAESDFYLPNKVDNLAITNSVFEGSVRFIDAPFMTSEDWTIIVTGSRWLANNLHADGRMIYMGTRGPLVLIGNFFEQAYDKPLQIYNAAWNGIASVISIGNSFASNLPDVFTGNATVMSLGNLITNNSFENDDTHLDGLRLFRVTAAQLAAAPWSTMGNANLTFCTDCVQATSCTGGGLGALAVRSNGAWNCGSSAGSLAGTIGTIHLPMSAAQFPPTDFAVYDGSETNGRLRFDGGAIVECAYWGPFRMNSDYASLPVFKFQYSMTSATSGGVAIGVYVMTDSANNIFDMNTESYGAVNTCTQTPVPSTLGAYKEISCPLTNNDGMAAGRFTKIRLCRLTGDAVDTASTSDLEGLDASLEYTR